jgi:hypothetical protein
MPLFNKPLKTKKGKTPAYLFGGLRGKSETDDSAVVYYERIDVTMKKWGESLIVRLQMVVDKSGRKLREGFQLPYTLFQVFMQSSKSNCVSCVTTRSLS